MKKAISWLISILGSFFFTVLATAQEPENLIDSTFVVFDTLRIKFPKVYWFNSYKFQIENYGNGVSKTKKNNSRHYGRQEYEENITTYKFNITLENFQSESSYIEGDFTRHEYYTVKNDILLQVLTGIESESTELLGMSQRKTATITTSLHEEPWDIIFYESSSFENPNELPVLLTSRSRTILVVPVSVSTNLLTMGIFNYSAFAFMENGVEIGRLEKGKEHLILLGKNVNPLTKLVLISAMMFVYG